MKDEEKKIKVQVDLDLSDRLCVVKVKRLDGRRLSIFNLLEGLNMAAANISMTAEAQMNKGNAQYLLMIEDGTIVATLPFSSADKNQKAEPFDKSPNHIEIPKEKH